MSRHDDFTEAEAEEIAAAEFRRALALEPPAPDLLPELHDVPATDLDVDRDTEIRAEERDRRWEEDYANV